MADECNGFNKEGCIEVSQKRVIITVTPVEHQKEKDKFNLAERNKRVAARRSEKNHARQCNDGA
jgi:F0F1-type ATP synthase epsilon subunit